MSYALTIHDIPDDLYEALRAEAASLGTSMNKAAKALMSSALGLVNRKRPDHSAELAPFYGGLDDETWSAARESVAEGRKIDPEDWA